MPKYLGIDPGTRGGAGLCIYDSVPDPDSGSHVVEAITVPRDPHRTTIQMILTVRDRVKAMVIHHAPEAVGREDHNFIGHVERMSRNILRKMNGALDVLCCDMGFTPGSTYFAFAPGSWKVIAGLPGDLGKEIVAQVEGQRFAKGQKKKKGTPEQYLAQANAILGYKHATTDAADAHGIAKAVATLRGIASNTIDFWELPTGIKDALWDREKALGRTRAAIEKAAVAHSSVDPTASKFMRSFSP